MANRVMAVDLSLNAKGYEDGIKQAKESTEQFTNAVDDIKKSLPNARREMAQVKKEVQNLALAYSRLTKEQKMSAEGRQLANMLRQIIFSMTNLLKMETTHCL